MNILIVSQYFWPESFRINDIASGLQDNVYKVTVLTGQPNYPGGSFYPGYGFFKKLKEEYQGVKVLRVPLLPRAGAGGVRLALNFFSFVFSASLIAPFRCRGKFDVIFVFANSPITVALPALVLKKIKKTPVILWYQDLWPESLSATGAIRSVWILNIVEKMVRFIYRGCNQIFVQSKAFYSPIEKLGVNQKDIRYFPNSAESLYQPITLDENAPERASMPTGFRVMFAGNIGAAQDFETILAAAEVLKNQLDIHWVIIGDGRKVPWVKEQIQARGLSKTVHLLGRHPVEAMPRYFSLADVMLVTLKKEPIFALTVPAKMQSYLACGKPIIAALDGEGAKIINEAEAGLANPAESPEELASSVLKIYRMSNSEREAMGQRGRQYFDNNFERNMLIQKLEGWFQEIAEQ